MDAKVESQSLKDRENRTHKEQEVEEKQKVLGGRDATFAHSAGSKMEKETEQTFQDIVFSKHYKL